MQDNNHNDTARWPLAICSWSLQTDVDGIAAAMDQLGIDRVNLALKPAFISADYLPAVRRRQWTISCMTIGFPQEDYRTLESIRATGGIVPDEHWEANRQRVLESIALTADFGVPYLSLHAGFFSPHQAGYSRFCERMACLADAAAASGVVLLMETGQETAAELRQFLEEMNHPALGVNFDPANMILYGMGNPIEALPVLGPWIRHLHVKDALYAKEPGTWGVEAPWGDGEVGGPAFLRALAAIGYQGTLAIERESGTDRQGDIGLAVRRLREGGGR
jgi:L-ribulose-5-phosphate 3-epimerase